jgi:tetratricopeptide (TPR) repeat protein
VANPLGIFFSRLAPEDKQFIKKVGIFLTVLLILSGGAFYYYIRYGKGVVEKLEEKITQTEIPADTTKDTIKNTDTSTMTFDMPASPEVPDYEEPPPVVEQTEKDPFDEDFDGQAHLELMRQNASKYNYKMAYRHGARIISALLADPKLSIEWGHILLEAGKPQEAVLVLQQIASKDTVKTEVAIDMAFAMLRSGNADGAIEFLDEKMKNSKDMNLLAAKAAIIGEHPDMAKRAAAGPIFSKYMKNKKLSPDADYWYGRFLMQRGDYRDSKIYLERAAKAKPNEPRYIARLGMAEFYLKRDSDAEVLYKKALQINPYDYNTWFNLGELYLSVANESSFSPEIRQKTRKAFEAYLKTLEHDSLHASANYRIGLILNGNGQHKEAIKHLNIALNKTPRDIPIMQQLSSAYIKIGDTAQSVSYLDTILQIDPFNKIAASEFNRIVKLRMENNK